MAYPRWNRMLLAVVYQVLFGNFDLLVELTGGWASYSTPAIV
jgi:hypothetical protein